jgi:hypothetical protein
LEGLKGDEDKWGIGAEARQKVFDFSLAGVEPGQLAILDDNGIGREEEVHPEAKQEESDRPERDPQERVVPRARGSLGIRGV